MSGAAAGAGADASAPRSPPAAAPAPPPPQATTTHAIELHMYDISNGLARSFAPMLGIPLEAIWHSSVVVRDSSGGGALAAEETFFGLGVQTARAGTTPFGTPLRVLPLGHTELDADTRRALLRELSERYRPCHYDLVAKNCNHFAHEYAELLCGQGAPREVVEQAEVLLRTPLGRMVEPLLRQAGAAVTGRATATGWAPRG